MARISGETVAAIWISSSSWGDGGWYASLVAAAKWLRARDARAWRLSW